ncbi:hypothetical protein Tcan_07148 [Toxocara canis]|uniref:Uncharacterized protein n=1 Tax=Toxocara canis TaxID=6265 RepID=A0A0B2VFV9_TOXCA|nr:hypothetical protein Tcan_07148 [Toxocara canis]
MDRDDSGGELIHRDLYDLEKRINRNHRRRLNWNTLDNENLSEITENTVLDDSIIAGPANQSRIADLETQFLLNPVLHSTQRSAHHMNLAQRRTSTAVSAGNSTTSRNAKITSSRTFKGAVEGSTVASAREKRQVLKQRERSPKSRERSSEGDGECESDARLISWVNTTKRSVVPSAFIDTKELRNEVEGIRSKRIKVEPVDNNEGLDNSANEVSF